MLSRKEQDKAGSELPENWCEQTELTLYSTYQTHCDNSNKNFKVHGFTYQDELFLTASYQSLVDEKMTPVTYVVSADFFGKGQNVEKLLNTLVDTIGIFFDQYFSETDWNDYQVIWTEGSYNGQDFFYKVTRENIALSIQAEQLLNQ